MPEILQRNFTGGELDPALHARADLTKYRNGLATLRNFKIHPQGGVSNREGLEYIEAKSAVTDALVAVQLLAPLDLIEAALEAQEQAEADSRQYDRKAFSARLQQFINLAKREMGTE